MQYYSTQGCKLSGLLAVVFEGCEIARSKLHLDHDLVNLVGCDGRPLQTRSHFSRQQDYTGSFKSH